MLLTAGEMFEQTDQVCTLEKSIVCKLGVEDMQEIKEGLINILARSLTYR